jgi:hypothetical protein
VDTEPEEFHPPLAEHGDGEPVSAGAIGGGAAEQDTADLYAEEGSNRTALFPNSKILLYSRRIGSLRGRSTRKRLEGRSVVSVSGPARFVVSELLGQRGRTTAATR